MRFVDIVFTASPESFRIKSPKVAIVGHGIDTEAFRPDMKEASIDTRIVTVGRIAGSKHIIEMLGVLDELYARGGKFTFTIVGGPGTKAEEEYAAQLEAKIAARPYNSKVRFLGPISPSRVRDLLNTQDIFLNFSTTGSMDKAVLEALAMGVPAVTTNEAFAEMLSPFGLYIAERDYGVLADAIDTIMNRPDRAAVVATLARQGGYRALAHAPYPKDSFSVRISCMTEVQVDKKHYEFARYGFEERFISYYWQLKLVLELSRPLYLRWVSVMRCSGTFLKKIPRSHILRLILRRTCPRCDRQRHRYPGRQ
jgi:glycosyltransferase involved in cell wall biosynthesis